MNFFQFNIGNYAAATSHLSLVEDAIYIRLLIVYYRDESPLPSDIKKTGWLVGLRTKKEFEFLERILRAYFILEADGWHNKRADNELASYYANGGQRRA